MNQAEQQKLLEQIIAKCESLLEAMKGIQPQAAKEAIKLYESGKCTLCKEAVVDGDVAFRGAHSACHKRIQRMISAGELTDAEAVAQGFWLERGYIKTGNPGVDSEVTRYVAAKKSAQDAKDARKAKRKH